MTALEPHSTSPFPPRTEAKTSPLYAWLLGARWRWATVLAAGYYLAAAVSSRLTLEPSFVASFWFPSGVALGAFLIAARRDWWVVALAIAVGDVAGGVAEEGRATTIWLPMEAASIVSPLIGAWLVRRFVAERPTLATMGEVVGILGLGAGLNLALAAAVGAWTLQRIGTEQAFWQTWRAFYFSDLLGVMLITPLLLVWRGRLAEPLRWGWTRRRSEALVLLVGLLAAISGAMIYAWWLGPGLRYSVFPFVLWAAIRFGPRGVTLVSLLVALLAGWLALHGFGPTAPEGATATERSLQLQIALSAMAFFGLIPAIVIAALRRAEAALQRERFTIERASIPIFWAGPDARIADSNAAMARLLGYTREELRDLTIGDIDVEFSPERWPRTWAELKRDQTMAFLSRQRRKDGTLIDVEVNTHFVLVGRDELSCAFVQDVTLRTENEQRIRSLNQRLELAVRGAGYGVWEFRLDTAELIWDERMYTIYGHTRATFDGSRDAWRACVHPDSRAIVDERFADLIAGRRVDYFEFRIIRGTDGVVRDIEANGFLQAEAAGRPQRLVGMNRDITGQKQAEEARHTSEEQLRLIFSAVAGGIVVLDRDLRIIQSNAAAERILGLPENYLMGRTVDERRAREIREDGSLFAPDEVPSAVALRTGRPARDVIMGVHRPDGAIAWICVNVEPLRDADGKVSMLVTSFSDITESRALHERVRQTQKMEVVGQLAGGVAHDFNNILTAMMLNLQLMKSESWLPDELRPRLDDLNLMALRAAKLTEQLLLFARRRRLELKPLELNAGLKNVLKLLDRLIGEHINVRLEIAPEACWISADSGMIDQVVMNLCVNARDAMAGGGTLTLETDTVERSPAEAHGTGGGRFVRLRVRDTGCGMAPEVSAHLFEPFFTTKEVGKGTGLGLATVHGIVQEHKGWIEVETAVGEGTTFSVFLPSAQPAEPAASPPAQSAMPKGDETIFLVEDEPSVRLVAATMLRRLGYRVIEAGDGREALAVWAARGAEISLLVTDVVMPNGVSGIELGERLRREKPDLGVIFMSGYNDQILKGEAGMPRNFTLIGKPFDFAELAAVVRRKLDESRR